MKQYVGCAVLLVVAVAILVLFASAYSVQEGKQAVITQFGKPVRYVTEAGLHFKVPLIQTVHLLEKRLLPWDGDPENMQTRDKKRIFIDVWARWRVADPERFFTAVRTEQKGQKMLDDLVDAAVRDVVARNNLIDVVRSTNEELVYETDDMTELAQGTQAARDVVTTGRAKMEAEILETVAAELEKNRYGMELCDVHVKRVNYIQSVKDTVYDRMRSERLRIAKLFESEAQEEQNKIAGVTRKELDLIEGEMKQKSAEIRGAADAEVIRLTAAAYGRSPEFFQFMRRLELLEQTLGRETQLILSTRSDLFQLFQDSGLPSPLAPSALPAGP